MNQRLYTFINVLDDRALKHYHHQSGHRLQPVGRAATFDYKELLEWGGFTQGLPPAHPDLPGGKAILSQTLALQRLIYFLAISNR